MGTAKNGSAQPASIMNPDQELTVPVAAQARRQTYQAEDNVTVEYCHWEVTAPVRAVVQIVHGAAEHIGRYEQFARFLVANGYAVYGADLRRHGHTRVGSGDLGDAGPDGWHHFVQDTARLGRLIRESLPGAPLVLFGHSLGSLVALDLFARRPDGMDGLILSGIPGAPTLDEDLAATVFAAADTQPEGPSSIWAELFAGFNRPFSEEPGFDFLSRDKAEVQRYAQDSLCGFGFNNRLARDVLVGITGLNGSVPAEGLRSELPVLVLQGDRDPVGVNLEVARTWLGRFEQWGLRRVAHRFYPGARHELLHEINRDEVYRDILDWLHRSV